jgi:hypothetical protein
MQMQTGAPIKDSIALFIWLPLQKSRISAPNFLRTLLLFSLVRILLIQRFTLKVSSVLQISKNCLGFEILRAVVKKNFIFWDITPCNPLKVNRCVGGKCRLHLQKACHLLQADFLLGLFFDPEEEATCCSETSVEF